MSGDGDGGCGIWAGILLLGVVLFGLATLIGVTFLP